MNPAGGLSRSLQLLIGGVVAAGAVLVVYWLTGIDDWSTADAAACAGILVSTAVAERFPLVLRLRKEYDDYSLSDAIWAGSLLLVDPDVLAVAAAGGLLLGLGLRRQPPIKLAFNVGQDVLAISAALALFGWLGSPPADSPAGWAAAALAMGVYRLVNTVIVGALLALMERRPLAETLLAMTGLRQWIGNVAIGLLGALVWTAEPFGLPLLLIPLALTVLAYRGWLRTLEERDSMAVMGQTANSIATSDDLSTRLASPRDDGGPVDQLASTLNRMLERLELSFRRERTFIRETSHELRTPITISRGYLEVLGRSPSAAELDETRVVVLDELDRMARIVEDMCDITLMEDPHSLRRTELDLARFVDDLTSKAQPLLNGRLHVRLQAEGAVMADGHRLTQALINLLKNAAQHTPPGTAIELGVARRDGSWRFDVSDAGGGLPVEAEAMAFQPFFKGEASDGSGLGLAIVHGIARAHGGRAGLENRHGSGATFWVEIPR